ncbi:MAG: hypothetical protein RIT15_230 [Pseudomonadota bacterium]|jgi:hypothetical protein
MGSIAFILAEAQGFEPWKPFGLPVFKTGAIDHSARLPLLQAHDSTTLETTTSLFIEWCFSRCNFSNQFMNIIFSLFRRIGLLALSLSLGGCAVLMPTAQTPYQLGEGLTSTPATSWKWIDARTSVPAENTSTRDGLIFGESGLQPSSFEFIQAEFARAVAKYDEREALEAKLRGQTLRLLSFEGSAGLRIRLSENQQGKWEVIRAHLVVTVGDTQYEASDVRTFNNSDKPSPLSPSIADAISGLVRQIHMF